MVYDFSYVWCAVYHVYIKLNPNWLWFSFTKSSLAEIWPLSKAASGMKVNFNQERILHNFNIAKYRNRGCRRCYISLCEGNYQRWYSPISFVHISFDRGLSYSTIRDMIGSKKKCESIPSKTDSLIHLFACFEFQLGSIPSLSPIRLKFSALNSS